MANNINKEWWRAMNGTPTRPSNKYQESRRTVNKNRTLHKAEYGQDNNLIIHERR
jgi:hypothetical protein